MMDSAMSESQFDYSRAEDLVIIRKVPEVTVVFWIVKLLSTAMGNQHRIIWCTRSTPMLPSLQGSWDWG